MTTPIERLRELSGIVESRPAYSFGFNEEARYLRIVTEQITNATESDLHREIASLVVECASLETLLTEGKIHHKEMGQVANRHDVVQSAEQHRLKALGAVRNVNKYKIRKRAEHLPPFKDQRTGHLGDPSKPESETSRAHRMGKLHSIAHFHHHNASKAYTQLANQTDNEKTKENYERRARRHAAAGSIHQQRAADINKKLAGDANPTLTGGKRVHLTTGKWVGHLKPKEDKPASALSQKAASLGQKKKLHP